MSVVAEQGERIDRRTRHHRRRRRRRHVNTPPPICPHILLPSLLLLLVVVIVDHAVRASSAAGQETLIGVAGRDFVVLGADSSSGGAAGGGIALTTSDADKIRLIVDPTPLPSRRREDLGAGIVVEDEGEEGEDYHRGTATNVQRCVAAAAAGDPADVDRIVGILLAHAAAAEYGAGVGRDVEFVGRCGGGCVPAAAGVRSERPPIAPSPGGLDAEGVAHFARAEISSRLRTAEPLRVCLLVAGMVEVVGGSEGGTGGAKKAGGIIGVGEDGGDAAPQTLVSPFSRRIREQVEAAAREVAGSDDDIQDGEGSEEPSSSSSTAATTGSTGNGRQRAVRSTLQPRLLWLDEYGSLQRLDYGAHGYGANFALSILDRGYRRDMTRGEAVDLVRDCFDQLRGRYVINSPEPPRIKCVDARGCAPVVVPRG